MEDKKKAVVAANEKPVIKAGNKTFYPLATINHPFFSFQYTKQVISADEKKTRIFSESHKYENGKLESESFSGTLPGNFFSGTMELFQKQMISNMETIVKNFTSLFGIR
jgi:hypothetical protein